MSCMRAIAQVACRCQCSELASKPRFTYKAIKKRNKEPMLQRIKSVKRIQDFCLIRIENVRNLKI